MRRAARRWLLGAAAAAAGGVLAFLALRGERPSPAPAPARAPAASGSVAGALPGGASSPDEGAGGAPAQAPAGQVARQVRPAPVPGTEGGPGPAPGSRSGARALAGGGSPEPGLPPGVLPPEEHRRALAALSPPAATSYLALRIRRIAADTERRVEGLDRERRRELKRRLALLRRAVGIAKRRLADEPAGAAAALEELRALEDAVERWRAAVLDGDDALPELPDVPSVRAAAAGS